MAVNRAEAQIEALSSPALRRWWVRVRERLERDPAALSGGTLSLPDADEAERAAMLALLGRRSEARTLSVALADLDRVLREGPAGLTLTDWLSREGPLVDRPAERAREDAAVEAILTRAEADADLLAGLRAGGHARRLVRAGRADEVDQALRVLTALPGGDVPLASFANAVLGHAKALDGTPVESHVLATLARRVQVDKPVGTEARRELWERFGVVPDDLASQVLVLNVRGQGSRLAAWLADALGVPFRVTLHQLVRFPLTFEGPVFVCENPAVLRQAAERLGAACPTLVCTEGRPSAAFWRLLRGARDPVRVRADFDPAGLGIIGAIVARGAQPWRMDLATYDLAAGSLAFAGTLRDVAWAPGLGARMREIGRLGEEERIVELLLADLCAIDAIPSPEPLDIAESTR